MDDEQHTESGSEQQDQPQEQASAASITEGLGDYLATGKGATKFTFNEPQWEGTGTLLDEPVLLVEQQTGLLETNANYDVKSNDGDTLGTVRQVGQSQAKQLVRAFSKFDKYMTHKFELVDPDDNVLLRITRPAKLRKSKIVVEDGDGNEVGRIVQENVFGKIRFGLEADGEKVGQIKGKSRADWDFVVTDADDDEVGRITKSFAGLQKAFLKGDDNYVVGMHRRLEDPLRLLVVAAGVGIDTALHIDD